MPRVTQQQYLDRHAELRKLWLADRWQFARLTPKQQWLLYLFYLPAEERTNGELLEHWAVITTQNSSLPQQAGKLYVALRQGVDRGLRRGRTITRGKLRGYHLAIRAVVRPKPDARKFATGLLDIARQPKEKA